MQLFELVRQTPWAKVKPCLLEAYPDSDGSSYERHFLNLRYLEPASTSMQLWLERVVDENNDYIDVSGQDGSRLKDTEDFARYPEHFNPENAEMLVKYGLGFMPWEEWLGMKIPSETLLEYSHPEIIAHCLWEMTFYGFDQQKIQAELEDLQCRAEEFYSVTPEERAANSLTLEQLKEKLGWTEEN